MKTINKLVMVASLLSTAALTAPAGAQSPDRVNQTQAPDLVLAAAAAADLTEGEIRKIDKEQGKVTLKHGPIKNLDMPPMTMVFTVRDKAMLNSIKPGDKVRFRAEDANGKITVIEMTPAK